jgi:hypothetical protein
MDFSMVSTSNDDAANSDLIRTISRHSLAYMLCAASEMFRHYDFDPLDLLIIHAVPNANALNVMKDPKLDRRFGSLHTVEPDEIKQGVSPGRAVAVFGPAHRNRPATGRSIEERGRSPRDRPWIDRDGGQSIQIRQQSRAAKNQHPAGAEIPS